MVLPDISRLPLHPVKQFTVFHDAPCATATNPDTVAEMYAARSAEQAATEHFVAAADAAAASAAALNAAKAEEERTKPRDVARVPYFDRLRDATRDLSVSDSVLYWASTCLPYVQHVPIEPRFVTQAQDLLQVLDLDQNHEEYYHRMSQPGGIATTPDPKFNFWLKYTWLACFFSIQADYDLIFLMDTPHSWYGSDKHYWWSMHLVGSPVYAAINTPLKRAENILIALEDEHSNATAVAARAQSASDLANAAQESARIAALSAVARANAARAAATASMAQ